MEKGLDKESRFRGRARRSDSIGMNVFVHGAAATPTPLSQGDGRADALEGVRLIICTPRGETPFHRAWLRRSLLLHLAFPPGLPLRKPIRGKSDFMPIFSLISRAIPVGKDPAGMSRSCNSSPPDKHGFCTLGTSVDTAKAAADSGRLNHRRDTEQMPHVRRRTRWCRSIGRLVIQRTAPSSNRSRAGDGGEAAHRRDRRRLVEDVRHVQMAAERYRTRRSSACAGKRRSGISTPRFLGSRGELFKPADHQPAQERPYRIESHEFRERPRTSSSVSLIDNPRVEFHPCDAEQPPRSSGERQVVAINFMPSGRPTGQVSGLDRPTHLFGIGGPP